MISIINNEQTPYIGLSTDLASFVPVQLANGTPFYEMDTGTLKFWDAENKQWVPET